MEQIPRIIRNLEHPIVIIADKNRRKEPYIQFFDVIKDFRDSATHYSIDKEIIWHSPEKWNEIIEMAAITTLNVAKTFWRECFPNEPYPEYLKEFDIDKLEKIANRNLDYTKRFFSWV